MGHGDVVVRRWRRNKQAKRHNHVFSFLKYKYNAGYISSPVQYPFRVILAMPYS